MLSTGATTQQPLRQQHCCNTLVAYTHLTAFCYNLISILAVFLQKLQALRRSNAAQRLCSLMPDHGMLAGVLEHPPTCQQATGWSLSTSKQLAVSRSALGVL